MNKALFLSAIIAIGAVSADERYNLLSKKETANVVTSKILTLDYTMEGDVNYKINLPELKAIINWNPSDSTQGIRSFVGLEVNSYLNFTVKAELMQKTIQKLTFSLMPFRLYPLLDYFSTTRSTSSGLVTFYNKLSAYLQLGEIHTLYYSNWKSCGNTFVNSDGSNNFDDAFLISYCGYNEESELASEDSATYFPSLYGSRWQKEIKLWEYTEYKY
eukprot:403335338